MAWMFEFFVVARKLDIDNAAMYLCVLNKADTDTNANANIISIFIWQSCEDVHVNLAVFMCRLPSSSWRRELDESDVFYNNIIITFDYNVCDR